jgi:hypothetical protein
MYYTEPLSEDRYGFSADIIERQNASPLSK